MSGPTVAQMAGVVGVEAALAGIRVFESPRSLRYDEMYVGRLGSVSGIVVGEKAHFDWRIHQLAANKLAREAARAHIEAVATRVLGEPWRVAPRQK